jgi:glycosyltransferase involved in cell wall biosynthesis
VTEGQSSSQPLVTVLLPCYNAEKFLAAALDSILGQTYRNLDVLAIDDGSRDATSQMLARYANQDRRVRLEPNDKNLGLIATLNRGVSIARGTLLARMDADDIAMPRRIEEQVRYFARHPTTELLSTDVSYIRENGELLFNPSPNRFSSRVLRFLMFFLNPICHPTVMGRRAVFERFPYSSAALHTEDLELWSRMLDHGVVFRQIPQRLLRFRPNIGSVSARNEEQQTEVFLRISADAIARYFDIRLEPGVHRILTARMLHGLVRGAELSIALERFDQMRRVYSERERLGRGDRALLARFADRHLANILHRSYARSSTEDPARSVAARGIGRLALRRPAALVAQAVERMRSRLRS